MAFTSRCKRPINRTIPYLRDTRLIIIATEGTDTERQYFESELFYNHRVQVKVLKTIGGLSAPNHVLKRLKEFAKETDLQGDDQLWLMVDKDRWGEKLLSFVCSHAIKGRRHTAKLSISNPCFEIWLYLHCSNWSKGSVNSSDIEKELRSVLGSYNKSNINIANFASGVDKAVKRAEKMDTQSGVRWPSNPGTHVYKVVKEIRNLMS